MALSNSLGSGTFKFDDIVNVILSVEVRRKFSGDSLVSESSLNVERRCRLLVKGSKSSRSKSRGKGRVQCFYCKEFRHIKRDCLECVNKNKGDSPSGVVTMTTQKKDEHEEYLGDSLTVSKDMNSTS